jgi:hypothetical protein
MLLSIVAKFESPDSGRYIYAVVANKSIGANERMLVACRNRYVCTSV